MIRNSRELGDNLKLIINRLSKNQNLVKLLYCIIINANQS